MATVNASGENILPSIPASAAIGTNVKAIISSPKMLGLRTSTAALSTPAIVLPSVPVRERWRCTFSTWMIVASITMPMEIARPPRDIRFASSPTARITMKVSSAESGRATMTTSAPRTLQRKSASTTSTRIAPSPSARSTVRVLASTTDERS